MPTPSPARCLAVTILAGALLGCSKGEPQPPEPAQIPSPATPPSAEVSPAQPVGLPSPDQLDQLGWAYRIPGHDFEITLLGRGWQLSTKASKKVANFYRPRPTMLCSVVIAVPDESGTLYEENIKSFRDLNKRTPSTHDTAEFRGTNDHGYPTWLLTSEERRDGRAALVGVSVTWLDRKKTVVLLFEGQFASDAPADLERDRTLFRVNAKAALRSARPVGTPKPGELPIDK